MIIYLTAHQYITINIFKQQRHLCIFVFATYFHSLEEYNGRIQPIKASKNTIAHNRIQRVNNSVRFDLQGMRGHPVRRGRFTVGCDRVTWGHTLLSQL